MPESDLKARVVWMDASNPKNDFERQVMESAEHAEKHLDEGYASCIECGLNQSAAQSLGMFVACQRLLARHLIQHCSNGLLTQEQTMSEIGSIVTNITRLVNDHYPQALAGALEIAAKKGSVQ